MRKKPVQSAANSKKYEGFCSKVLQIPQNMKCMPSKVLPIARNIDIILFVSKSCKYHQIPVKNQHQVPKCCKYQQNQDKNNTSLKTLQITRIRKIEMQ